MGKSYRERYEKAADKAREKAVEECALVNGRPDELALAGLIVKVSKWDQSLKEEVRNAFYGFVSQLGEEHFPEYLRANQRREFKKDLANDREFCRRAGISYTEVEKHYIDIDNALAVFYSKRVNPFIVF